MHQLKWPKQNKSKTVLFWSFLSFSSPCVSAAGLLHGGADAVHPGSQSVSDRSDHRQRHPLSVPVRPRYHLCGPFGEAAASQCITIKRKLEPPEEKATGFFI